jgi:NADP-dependent 3-hydroxy acid dehydrogenase YdfG
MELGPKMVRTAVLEPGIVQTELKNHTNAGTQEWLAGMAEQIELLVPRDVAEVAAFVAEQPRRVNLSHVRVMPTQEEV